MISPFDKIADWKTFERFCADLLSAEGFLVESEPSIDTSGTDIVATETYRSHDSRRIITVRWRIQCKHYGRSRRNLDRREVEASIYAYEARRCHDEGLFFIVSSDYTEPASAAIDAYVASRPGARVTVWNGRELTARLERHPALLRRYGLEPTAHGALRTFSELERFAGSRVLFVSDQSAFAHDLGRELRRLAFEVVFLPVWNYTSSGRLELFLKEYATMRFSLVILFLGDTFGVAMPRSLVDWIQSQQSEGANVLFFPFLAWLLRCEHEYLRPLEALCPVTITSDLHNPDELLVGPLAAMLRGESRRGDFSWLLQLEGFAEDRFVEYDPSGASPWVRRGIESRFGVSHSFEYLRLSDGSQAAWVDSSGNILVATRDTGRGRVAYINSCTHACLSTVAVSSPLQASDQFGMLTANVLRWLLESANPTLQPTGSAGG